MATTRLMPLHTGKGRTVGQAISDIIDYTENPQKTDGGRLITSWQCDSRIADAEFLFAKNQYTQKTGRVRGEDDVIAYHLRQSFVPGEITPEDANRLGCELAKRFTKGNHAYINLTIPDEQCVLLCGRSGCGKTTLTRLINGLIPQFFAGELTGKVLLDGENLFDLPMYRIAEKVGSVFQNPRTQFFNVDTDSEIAFGMENEAVPQEQMGQRVVETAKALRIENLLGRNIFALSGGEKQKIAFASVYAMNPQIYLLDEPSSNLDMAAIHDLRAHLRLIKSQGKTIVVAEHRLYYLMDVADRIVYLDNGHIAGDWTPEQFRLLSTEKRQSMGLRALDLQDEKPICAAVPKQPPVFL